MLTFDEIKNMTDQEVAEANKKLMKRMVLTRIVAPIALTVAFHYGLNFLVKKIENSDTED